MKTYLEQYHDEIRKGNIVVGYWIRKELDNLLADLNDPRYIFDPSHCYMRFAFQERFCLQSKAPYYMKPIQLMLWQKAFWEALYSFKMADTGFRRFNEALLVVARKNGKALALDTRIPTPDGDKVMADINVGDYIYGANGKPAKVLATSEIFYGHKCYEVEFEDGEKIIADAGHIWRVYEKRHRREWADRTTEEMVADYAHARKDGKGVEYKYRVPMAHAVERAEANLPIDPYVLGVWLGDGLALSPRISCGEQDAEEIKNLLQEQHGYCEIERYKGGKVLLKLANVSRGKRNDIMTALRLLGVKGNKHIPEIYLSASIEQRRELLRGLMDTDGTCSKAGQCEFVQKNERLVNDFSRLLSSLGIKHNVQNKNASCNGKIIPVYRVTFFVDMAHPCFKFERKKARLKERLADRMEAKSVVSIREVDSVPTKCLCVEGGLYLCGNKNTVTHNSTMFAADGNTDLFIGEGGTDICCASNDDRQAKLIWREIDGMRRRLDPKKEITGANLVELRNELKNITVFRLSSKTQNKDGFNIDKTYLDESHDIKEENKQSEIAEACWRGMSSKDEPLFMNCTTQGFNRECYLDGKIETAKAIIDGEIDDIHFLPFLYMQDNEQEIWQDEASWEKSNPSIRYGVKKVAKLERDIETAKRDNATRIHMLVKDFNIPQNTAAAWLMLEDYDYPQEVKSLEDFRGCFCLAAVDLSETTDMTNCKLLFMRPNDNTKYIFSHYWIPASKLDSSDDKNAGAKYKEWAKEGLLTICDGNDNDLTLVADWIFELKKKYNILVLKCGYDVRFSRDFINRMDDYGIETELIQQSPAIMSNPMRLVEADLKSRVINYGNNPIDKWCLSNGAIEMNSKGQILCVKVNNQPSKRIDGAVTLIILYATLQRFRSEYMRYVK